VRRPNFRTIRARYDEGKVRGYALRVVDGQSLVHLYEPDRFYVKGRAGTQLRMELVNSTTGVPVGAPFEVFIGAHGLVVRAEDGANGGD
jgi:hypothetical protein